MVLVALLYAKIAGYIVAGFAAARAFYRKEIAAGKVDAAKVVAAVKAEVLKIEGEVKAEEAKLSTEARAAYNAVVARLKALL
jgi:hypothetical protein